MTIENTDRISYHDQAALAEALVGRRIVRFEDGKAKVDPDGYSWAREPYDRVLTFHLDNGAILTAHAHDGGCGCTNGCFTVEPPADLPRGTIMSVKVQEIAGTFDYDKGEEVRTEVTPGESGGDGSATIRLFVYTELGEVALVTSEGGDNGYYGWGYHLELHRPVLVVDEGEPRKVLES